MVPVIVRGLIDVVFTGVIVVSSFIQQDDRMLHTDGLWIVAASWFMNIMLQRLFLKLCVSYSRNISIDYFVKAVTIVKHLAGLAVEKKVQWT